jgi:hypothetical protein
MDEYHRFLLVGTKCKREITIRKTSTTTNQEILSLLRRVGERVICAEAEEIDGFIVATTNEVPQYEVLATLDNALNAIWKYKPGSIQVVVKAINTGQYLLFLTSSFLHISDEIADSRSKISDGLAGISSWGTYNTTDTFLQIVQALASSISAYKSLKL